MLRAVVIQIDGHGLIQRRPARSVDVQRHHYAADEVVRVDPHVDRQPVRRERLLQRRERLRGGAALGGRQRVGEVAEAELSVIVGGGDPAIRCGPSSTTLSETDRSDCRIWLGSLAVGFPASDESPGTLESFARSTSIHCLPDVGSEAVRPAGRSWYYSLPPHDFITEGNFGNNETT